MFQFLFYSLAKADEGGLPVEVIPTETFFVQVWELIKQFGGMPWTLKVSAIVLILLSSMKVSFLRPLWDKLGSFKPVAAPLLGLLAGVFSLGKQGDLSLPGITAYMFSGAGAIVLHELLNSVKGLPGIGKIYISAIDFLQKLLKRPADK